MNQSKPYVFESIQVLLLLQLTLITVNSLPLHYIKSGLIPFEAPEEGQEVQEISVQQKFALILLRLEGHPPIINIPNNGQLYSIGDLSQSRSILNFFSEYQKQEAFNLKPQKVRGIKREKIISISCSSTVMLALATSGTVYVCGQDPKSTGVLGLAEISVQNSVEPLKIFGRTIKFVSAGDKHAGAIDSFGHLYTWGSGQYGELGLPGVKKVTTPQHVEMPELRSNKQVNCRNNSTAIITTRGNALFLGTLKLIDALDMFWPDLAQSSVFGSSQLQNEQQQQQIKLKQITNPQFVNATITKLAVLDGYAAALTRKGELLLINNKYEAEKVDCAVQIVNFMTSRSKFFAFTENSAIIEWDLNQASKHSFLQPSGSVTTQRSQKPIDMDFLHARVFPFQDGVFNVRMVSSPVSRLAAISLNKRDELQQSQERSMLNASNLQSQSFMANKNQGIFNSLNRSGRLKLADSNQQQMLKQSRVSPPLDETVSQRITLQSSFMATLNQSRQSQLNNNEEYSQIFPKTTINSKGSGLGGLDQSKVLQQPNFKSSYTWRGNSNQQNQAISPRPEATQAIPNSSIERKKKEIKRMLSAGSIQNSRLNDSQMSGKSGVSRINIIRASPSADDKQKFGLESFKQDLQEQRHRLRSNRKSDVQQPQQQLLNVPNAQQASKSPMGQLQQQQTLFNQSEIMNRSINKNDQKKPMLISGSKRFYNNDNGGSLEHSRSKSEIQLEMSIRKASEEDTIFKNSMYKNQNTIEDDPELAAIAKQQTIVNQLKQLQQQKKKEQLDNEFHAMQYQVQIKERIDNLKMHFTKKNINTKLNEYVRNSPKKQGDQSYMDPQKSNIMKDITIQDQSVGKLSPIRVQPTLENEDLEQEQQQQQQQDSKISKNSDQQQRRSPRQKLQRSKQKEEENKKEEEEAINKKIKRMMKDNEARKNSFIQRWNKLDQNKKLINIEQDLLNSSLDKKKQWIMESQLGKPLEYFIDLIYMDENNPLYQQEGGAEGQGSAKRSHSQDEQAAHSASRLSPSYLNKSHSQQHSRRITKEQGCQTPDQAKGSPKSSHKDDVEEFGLDNLKIEETNTQDPNQQEVRNQAESEKNSATNVAAPAGGKNKFLSLINELKKKDPKDAQGNDQPKSSGAQQKVLQIKDKISQLRNQNKEKQQNRNPQQSLLNDFGAPGFLESQKERQFKENLVNITPIQSISSKIDPHYYSPRLNEADDVIILDDLQLAEIATEAIKRDPAFSGAEQQQMLEQLQDKQGNPEAKQALLKSLMNRYNIQPQQKQVKKSSEELINTILELQKQDESAPAQQQQQQQQPQIQKQLISELVSNSNPQMLNNAPGKKNLSEEILRYSIDKEKERLISKIIDHPQSTKEEKKRLISQIIFGSQPNTSSSNEATQQQQKGPTFSKAQEQKLEKILNGESQGNQKLRLIEQIVFETSQNAASPNNNLMHTPTKQTPQEQPSQLQTNNNAEPSKNPQEVQQKLIEAIVSGTQSPEEKKSLIQSIIKRDADQSASNSNSKAKSNLKKGVNLIKVAMAFQPKGKGFQPAQGLSKFTQLAKAAILNPATMAGNKEEGSESQKQLAPSSSQLSFELDFNLQEAGQEHQNRETVMNQYEESNHEEDPEVVEQQQLHQKLQEDLQQFTNPVNIIKEKESVLKQLRQITSNPNASKQQRAELITKICGDQLGLLPGEPLSEEQQIAMDLFLDQPESEDLRNHLVMSILEEKENQEKVKRSRQKREIEDFVQEVAQGNASKAQKVRLIASMYGKHKELTPQQLEIIDHLLEQPHNADLYNQIVEQILQNKAIDEQAQVQKLQEAIVQDHLQVQQQQQQGQVATQSQQLKVLSDIQKENLEREAVQKTALIEAISISNQSPQEKKKLISSIVFSGQPDQQQNLKQVKPQQQLGSSMISSQLTTPRPQQQLPQENNNFVDKFITQVAQSQSSKEDKANAIATLFAENQDHLSEEQKVLIETFVEDPKNEDLKQLLEMQVHIQATTEAQEHAQQIEQIMDSNKTQLAKQKQLQQLEQQRQQKEDARQIAAMQSVAAAEFSALEKQNLMQALLLKEQQIEQQKHQEIAKNPASAISKAIMISPEEAAKQKKESQVEATIQFISQVVQQSQSGSQSSKEGVLAALFGNEKSLDEEQQNLVQQCLQDEQNPSYDALRNLAEHVYNEHHAEQLEKEHLIQQVQNSLDHTAEEKLQMVANINKQSQMNAEAHHQALFDSINQGNFSVQDKTQLISTAVLQQQQQQDENEPQPQQQEEELTEFQQKEKVKRQKRQQETEDMLEQLTRGLENSNDIEAGFEQRFNVIAKMFGIGGEPTEEQRALIAEFLGDPLNEALREQLVQQILDQQDTAELEKLQNIQQVLQSNVDSEQKKLMLKEVTQLSQLAQEQQRMELASSIAAATNLDPQAKVGLISSIVATEQQPQQIDESEEAGASQLVEQILQAQSLANEEKATVLQSLFAQNNQNVRQSQLTQIKQQQLIQQLVQQPDNEKLKQQVADHIQKSKDDAEQSVGKQLQQLQQQQSLRTSQISPHKLNQLKQSIIQQQELQEKDSQVKAIETILQAAQPQSSEEAVNSQVVRQSIQEKQRLVSSILRFSQAGKKQVETQPTTLTTANMQGSARNQQQTQSNPEKTSAMSNLIQQIAQSQASKDDKASLLSSLFTGNAQKVQNSNPQAKQQQLLVEAFVQQPNNETVKQELAKQIALSQDSKSQEQKQIMDELLQGCQNVEEKRELLKSVHQQNREEQEAVQQKVIDMVVRGSFASADKKRLISSIVKSGKRDNSSPSPQSTHQEQKKAEAKVESLVQQIVQSSQASKQEKLGVLASLISSMSPSASPTSQSLKAQQQQQQEEEDRKDNDNQNTRKSGFIEKKQQEKQQQELLNALVEQPDNPEIMQKVVSIVTEVKQAGEQEKNRLVSSILQSKCRPEEKAQMIQSIHQKKKQEWENQQRQVLEQIEQGSYSPEEKQSLVQNVIDMKQNAGDQAGQQSRINKSGFFLNASIHSQKPLVVVPQEEPMPPNQQQQAEQIVSIVLGGSANPQEKETILSTLLGATITPEQQELIQQSTRQPENTQLQQQLVEQVLISNEKGQQEKQYMAQNVLDSNCFSMEQKQDLLTAINQQTKIEQHQIRKALAASLTASQFSPDQKLAVQASLESFQQNQQEQLLLKNDNDLVPPTDIIPEEGDNEEVGQQEKTKRSRRQREAENLLEGLVQGGQGSRSAIAAMILGGGDVLDPNRRPLTEEEEVLIDLYLRDPGNEEVRQEIVHHILDEQDSRSNSQLAMLKQVITSPCDPQVKAQMLQGVQEQIQTTEEQRQLNLAAAVAQTQIQPSDKIKAISSIINSTDGVDNNDNQQQDEDVQQVLTDLLSTSEITGADKAKVINSLFQQANQVDPRTSQKLQEEQQKLVNKLVAQPANEQLKQHVAEQIAISRQAFQQQEEQQIYEVTQNNKLNPQQQQQLIQQIKTQNQQQAVEIQAAVLDTVLQSDGGLRTSGVTGSNLRKSVQQKKQLIGSLLKLSQKAIAEADQFAQIPAQESTVKTSQLEQIQPSNKQKEKEAAQIIQQVAQSQASKEDKANVLLQLIGNQGDTSPQQQRASTTQQQQYLQIHHQQLINKVLAQPSNEQGIAELAAQVAYAQEQKNKEQNQLITAVIQACDSTDEKKEILKQISQSSKQEQEKAQQSIVDTVLRGSYSAAEKNALVAQLKKSEAAAGASTKPIKSDSSIKESQHLKQLEGQLKQQEQTEQLVANIVDSKSASPEEKLQVLSSLVLTKPTTNPLQEGSGQSSIRRSTSPSRVAEEQKKKMEQQQQQQLLKQLVEQPNNQELRTQVVQIVQSSLHSEDTSQLQQIIRSKDKPEEKARLIKSVHFQKKVEQESQQQQLIQQIQKGHYTPVEKEALLQSLTSLNQPTIVAQSTSSTTSAANVANDQLQQQTPNKEIQNTFKSGILKSILMKKSAEKQQQQQQTTKSTTSAHKMLEEQEQLSREHQFTVDQQKVVEEQNTENSAKIVSTVLQNKVVPLKKKLQVLSALLGKQSAEITSEQNTLLQQCATQPENQVLQEQLAREVQNSQWQALQEQQNMIQNVLDSNQFSLEQKQDLLTSINQQIKQDQLISQQVVAEALTESPFSTKEKRAIIDGLLTQQQLTQQLGQISQQNQPFQQQVIVSPKKSSASSSLQSSPIFKQMVKQQLNNYQQQQQQQQKPTNINNLQVQANSFTQDNPVVGGDKPIQKFVEQVLLSSATNQDKQEVLSKLLLPCGDEGQAQEGFSGRGDQKEINEEQQILLDLCISEPMNGEMMSQLVRQVEEAEQAREQERQILINTVQNSNKSIQEKQQIMASLKQQQVIEAQSQQIKIIEAITQGAYAPQEKKQLLSSLLLQNNPQVVNPVITQAATEEIKQQQQQSNDMNDLQLIQSQKLELLDKILGTPQSTSQEKINQVAAVIFNEQANYQQKKLIQYVIENPQNSDLKQKLVNQIPLPLIPSHEMHQSEVIQQILKSDASDDQKKNLLSTVVVAEPGEASQNLLQQLVQNQNNQLAQHNLIQQLQQQQQQSKKTPAQQIVDKPLQQVPQGQKVNNFLKSLSANKKQNDQANQQKNQQQQQQQEAIAQLVDSVCNQQTQPQTQQFPRQSQEIIAQLGAVQNQDFVVAQVIGSNLKSEEKAQVLCATVEQALKTQPEKQKTEILINSILKVKSSKDEKKRLISSVIAPEGSAPISTQQQKAIETLVDNQANEAKRAQIINSIAASSTSSSHSSLTKPNSKSSQDKLVKQIITGPLQDSEKAKLVSTILSDSLQQQPPMSSKQQQQVQAPGAVNETILKQVLSLPTVSNEEKKILIASITSQSQPEPQQQQAQRDPSPNAKTQLQKQTSDIGQATNYYSPYKAQTQGEGANQQGDSPAFQEAVVQDTPLNLLDTILNSQISKDDKLNLLSSIVQSTNSPPPTATDYAIQKLLLTDPSNPIYKQKVAQQLQSAVLIDEDQQLPSSSQHEYIQKQQNQLKLQKVIGVIASMNNLNSKQKQCEVNSILQQSADFPPYQQQPAFQQPQPADSAQYTQQLVNQILAQPVDKEEKKKMISSVIFGKEATQHEQKQTPSAANVTEAAIQQSSMVDQLLENSSNARMKQKILDQIIKQSEAIENRQKPQYGSNLDSPVQLRQMQQKQQQQKQERLIETILTNPKSSSIDKKQLISSLLCNNTPSPQQQQVIDDIVENPRIVPQSSDQDEQQKSRKKISFHSTPEQQSPLKDYPDHVQQLDNILDSLIQKQRQPQATKDLFQKLQKNFFYNNDKVQLAQKILSLESLNDDEKKQILQTVSLAPELDQDQVMLITSLINNQSQPLQSPLGSQQNPTAAKVDLQQLIEKIVVKQFEDETGEAGIDEIHESDENRFETQNLLNSMLQQECPLDQKLQKIRKLADSQVQLYPQQFNTLQLFNGQLSQQQASLLDTLMTLANSTNQIRNLPQTQQQINEIINQLSELLNDQTKQASIEYIKSVVSDPQMSPAVKRQILQEILISSQHQQNQQQQQSIEDQLMQSPYLQQNLETLQHLLQEGTSPATKQSILFNILQGDENRQPKIELINSVLFDQKWARQDKARVINLLLPGPSESAKDKFQRLQNRAKTARFISQQKISNPSSANSLNSQVKFAKGEKKRLIESLVFMQKGAVNVNNTNPLQLPQTTDNQRRTIIEQLVEEKNNDQRRRLVDSLFCPQDNNSYNKHLVLKLVQDQNEEDLIKEERHLLISSMLDLLSVKEKIVKNITQNDKHKDRNKFQPSQQQSPSQQHQKNEVRQLLIEKMLSEANESIGPERDGKLLLIKKLIKSQDDEKQLQQQRSSSSPQGSPSTKYFNQQLFNYDQGQAQILRESFNQQSLSPFTIKDKQVMLNVLLQDNPSVSNSQFLEYERSVDDIIKSKNQYIAAAQTPTNQININANVASGPAVGGQTTGENQVKQIASIFNSQNNSDDDQEFALQQNLNIQEAGQSSYPQQQVQQGSEPFYSSEQQQQLPQRFTHQNFGSFGGGQEETQQLVQQQQQPKEPNRLMESIKLMQQQLKGNSPNKQADQNKKKFNIRDACNQLIQDNLRTSQKQQPSTQINTASEASQTIKNKVDKLKMGLVSLLLKKSVANNPEVGSSQQIRTDTQQSQNNQEGLLQGRGGDVLQMQKTDLSNEIEEEPVQQNYSDVFKANPQQEIKDLIQNEIQKIQTAPSQQQLDQLSQLNKSQELNKSFKKSSRVDDMVAKYTKNLSPQKQQQSIVEDVNDTSSKQYQPIEQGQMDIQQLIQNQIKQEQQIYDSSPSRENRFLVQQTYQPNPDLKLSGINEQIKKIDNTIEALKVELSPSRSPKDGKYSNSPSPGKEQQQQLSPQNVSFLKYKELMNQELPQGIALDATQQSATVSQKLSTPVNIYEKYRIAPDQLLQQQQQQQQQYQQTQLPAFQNMADFAMRQQMNFQQLKPTSSNQNSLNNSRNYVNEYETITSDLMSKIFNKGNVVGQNQQQQLNQESPMHSDQLIQQDYEINKLIHYSPVKSMNQVNKLALIVLLKFEKFILKRKYIAMTQLKLLQFNQSPTKIQQILQLANNIQISTPNRMSSADARFSQQMQQSRPFSEQPRNLKFQPNQSYASPGNQSLEQSKNTRSNASLSLNQMSQQFKPNISVKNMVEKFSQDLLSTSPQQQLRLASPDQQQLQTGNKSLSSQLQQLTFAEKIIRKTEGYAKLAIAIHNVFQRVKRQGLSTINCFQKLLLNYNLFNLSISNIDKVFQNIKQRKLANAFHQLYFKAAVQNRKSMATDSTTQLNNIYKRSLDQVNPQIDSMTNMNQSKKSLLELCDQILANTNIKHLSPSNNRNSSNLKASRKDKQSLGTNQLQVPSSLYPQQNQFTQDSNIFETSYDNMREYNRSEQKKNKNQELINHYQDKINNRIEMNLMSRLESPNYQDRQNPIITDQFQPISQYADPKELSPFRCQTLPDGAQQRASPTKKYKMFSPPRIKVLSARSSRSNSRKNSIRFVHQYSNSAYNSPTKMYFNSREKMHKILSNSIASQSKNMVYSHSQGRLYSPSKRRIISSVKSKIMGSIQPSSKVFISQITPKSNVLVLPQNIQQSVKVYQPSPREKILNTSISMPPVKFIPVYDKVITSQMQFIAKKFKNLNKVACGQMIPKSPQRNSQKSIVHHHPQNTNMSTISYRSVSSYQPINSNPQMQLPEQQSQQQILLLPPPQHQQQKLILQKANQERPSQSLQLQPASKQFQQLHPILNQSTQIQQQQQTIQPQKEKLSLQNTQKGNSRQVLSPPQLYQQQPQKVIVVHEQQPLLKQSIPQMKKQN